MRRSTARAATPARSWRSSFSACATSSDTCGDLSAADFADGVHGGAAYARESLSEPREGTISPCCSDFAHEVNRVRREGVRDLRALLRRGVTVAEQSLAGTTQQLEALRKANVVDAGGQGFVELLAGVTDYIESGTEDEPAVPMPAVIDAASETTAGLEERRSNTRYCTECVVIGNRVDRRHLREELSAVGGSLVVAGQQHKVRVHIHANDPAEVFGSRDASGRSRARRPTTCSASRTRPMSSGARWPS